MIATFATRRVLASCVHSWFDKIFIHSELRNEWTVRGRQFRLMVPLGTVAILGMPEARVCKIKWTCANIAVHVITSPSCGILLRVANKKMHLSDDGLARNV
jgi:hypothetical protein